MNRFIIIFMFFSLEILPQFPQKIIDIPPPKGYTRVYADSNSFAHWLRSLPLKPPGSEVLDYRGRVFKSNTDSAVAYVVQTDIAGRKFDQCMDILLRFYALYLFKMNRHADIIFPLPGGTWLGFADWQKGLRPEFKGIEVDMGLSAPPDSSIESLNKFLETIFYHSHTQQFYFLYEPVTLSQILPGDFIVKKGVRGHAVLIVDMAQNQNDQKVVLIGQGDTPASEFIILNPSGTDRWFPVDVNSDYPVLPINKKMFWDGLRRFSSPKNTY